MIDLRKLLALTVVCIALPSAFLGVAPAHAEARPDAGVVAPSTPASTNAGTKSGTDGGARGELALIETPDGGVYVPHEKAARGPTIRERNAPRSRGGAVVSGTFMALMLVGAMAYYVVRRLRR